MLRADLEINLGRACSSRSFLAGWMLAALRSCVGVCGHSPPYASRKTSLIRYRQPVVLGTIVHSRLPTRDIFLGLTCSLPFCLHLQSVCTSTMLERNECLPRTRIEYNLGRKHDHEDALVLGDAPGRRGWTPMFWRRPLVTIANCWGHQWRIRHLVGSLWRPWPEGQVHRQRDVPDGPGCPNEGLGDGGVVPPGPLRHALCGKPSSQAPPRKAVSWWHPPLLGQPVRHGAVGQQEAGRHHTRWRTPAYRWLARTFAMTGPNTRLTLANNPILLKFPPPKTFFLPTLRMRSEVQREDNGACLGSWSGRWWWGKWLGQPRDHP